MATNSTALFVPPKTATPAAATSLSATNDLRPVKPPVPIPSGWEWAWWLGGALVIAALAFLLTRWWRHRQQPLAIPPTPPHVRARHRLAEALRLISEPKPFCTAVSDALRVYLEERFDFHAPDRTTEEFLNELQGTNRLNDPQKESLGKFLQICDLVKFARFEPTEESLRELHQSALRLVDETQFDPLTVPPVGSLPPELKTQNSKLKTR
jgi:hypothetical protein